MFEPNLPPEDGQNQKQLSSYPNESKSRPYLLSIFNENYSSFQICVFPALVLFFTLPDNFFDFGPIFKCHTQRMEKVNWISRSGLYAESSEKKSLKIIDGTISSHVISFRFPDTFR